MSFTPAPPLRSPFHKGSLFVCRKASPPKFPIAFLTGNWYHGRHEKTSFLFYQPEKCVYLAGGAGSDGFGSTPHRISLRERRGCGDGVVPNRTAGCGLSDLCADLTLQRRRTLLPDGSPGFHAGDLLRHQGLHCILPRSNRIRVLGGVSRHRGVLRRDGQRHGQEQLRPDRPACGGARRPALYAPRGPAHHGLAAASARRAGHALPARRSVHVTCNAAPPRR